MIKITVESIKDPDVWIKESDLHIESTDFFLVDAVRQGGYTQKQAVDPILFCCRGGVAVFFIENTVGYYNINDFAEKPLEFLNPRKVDVEIKVLDKVTK